MNLIEDLKYRNLIYDVTDEKLYEVLNQRPMTFYLGADPTSDSLHVGHLVTYLVAKRLAKHGHQPILLIGGGTGLIGDPSGRSTERVLLDLDTTMSHAKAIEKQVKKILPNAIVVNNYDWLKQYDIIRFLREVGKHFNINTMLAKDSVKSRLSDGISFTEFTYQIIQSLDWLTLLNDHQCTMQIGGQDQWGNITAGLDLIRKVKGIEQEAYGLVIPLITKKDGSKFGKTAEGTVWLDAEKTSAYAFYQYWINLDDDEAIERLKQFTDMDKEGIENIVQLMQETPHLRHAQKQLALDLTRLVHGETALKQALNITDALFNNTVQTLSVEELNMVFKEMPHITSIQPVSLIDALIDTGLASSKREARTFIKQNAIMINNEKVNDETMVIDNSQSIHGIYTVIKRGKKLYAFIKHTS